MQFPPEIIKQLNGLIINFNELYGAEDWDSLSESAECILKAAGLGWHDESCLNLLIAYGCYKQGKHEEGQLKAHASLDAAEGAGDRILIACALSLLADFYNIQDQIESALECYLEALKLSAEGSANYNLAAINAIECLVAKGRLVKALEFAEQLEMDACTPEGIELACLKSTLYYIIGDYVKALRMARLGLENANSSGFKEENIMLYWLVRKIAHHIEVIPPSEIVAIPAASPAVLQPAQQLEP